MRAAASQQSRSSAALRAAPLLLRFREFKPSAPSPARLPVRLLLSRSGDVAYSPVASAGQMQELPAFGGAEAMPATAAPPCPAHAPSVVRCALVATQERCSARANCTFLFRG